MKSKITVYYDQVIGKVHPHIYGHFIESLGRSVYGGIWAEMLKNRKFFSQYGDAPIRWVDDIEEGVVSPWFSIGKNENTYFTHDNTVFYSGSQSQRVDIKKLDGIEHGIGQASLGVQKDKEYICRIVIKYKELKNLPSPISVSSTPKLKVYLKEDKEIICKKEINIVSREWQTYKFKLRSNTDCNDAKFCITSTYPGTIWFGAVSLMPADNIYGMRKDVIELIKQIKPPIVRWPGGNFASGYHWKDGIGESDKRPTRWDYAWNALEYNDFGTDEYLRFCKEVGCEPLICINAGSLGTIKEAVEWVKYCKGKVKYWDIGNEMYGNWQLGHMDSETFAKRTLRFIKEMRKVDPKIKVIGCGVPVNSYSCWNDPLIKIAGKELDYLSVHDYTTSPSKDEDYLYHFIVSAPVRIEKMLKDTINYVKKLLPGKKIPLAFDEWNVWLPEANISTGMEMSYKMRDAIYAAGVFNAMQRLAENLKMANLAQIVNVLGAIHTDNIKAIPTPLWTAFQLYTAHTGKESVKVEVESPTFDVPGGSSELKDVPYIDCSATRGNSKIYFAIINRHPSEEIECKIILKNFPSGICTDKAIAFQMNAESFSSNQANISEFTISNFSSPFIKKFPPHSVTIIELEL